jgi:hypothetical protein
MRRAERAHSVERRVALLEMATGWAEAAAHIDHRFALIVEFDKLACEAKGSLHTAIDGRRQIIRPNGSGQTE